MLTAVITNILVCICVLFKSVQASGSFHPVVKFILPPLSGSMLRIETLQSKSLQLTLSSDEALEVDGNSYPHGLPVFLRPETPHTDVHGLGARLRRQASEEKRLLCEIIQFPALAFICGELDGLDLSFTLRLHCHNEAARV